MPTVLVRNGRVVTASESCETDVFVDHEAQFDMKLAQLTPDVVERYVDRMRHLWPVVRIDDL